MNWILDIAGFCFLIGLWLGVVRPLMRNWINGSASISFRAVSRTLLSARLLVLLIVLLWLSAFIFSIVVLMDVP